VIDGVAFAEDYDLPATIVAEVAYRTLRDKQEQDQQQGGDDQQQGGDDQQQGDDQQDGDQQGDGEGKAKDGGKLGHGKCGSCSGGDKAQGEDDVPDEVKAGKLERDAVEREVAQAIVDAAAKDPGSVPGEVLLRAQQRLAPSKTPWQNILRRHVRRALNQRNGYTEQTYARQSRRQSMHGAGAGSIVLPTTYDPQVEVAVVVDTSGSMGQQEMQAALAEVDGILRAARSAIRVLSCDKQVHLQGKVTRVAEAAKLLRGGGGTDFRPAFEALAKHRPGLTIVVTDGYGPAPKDAPRWTDTIWLLVGDYTTKPCEWGEFIEAK
jgi:predicted metal-dependent peptidase